MLLLPGESGTKVKKLHRQNNNSFPSASISAETEMEMRAIILCTLCMLLLPGTKVKKLHRQNNNSFPSASISAETEMEMRAFILCTLCMLVLPVVEAEPLKPSVVALEGEAVEIVCPTKESYESYFWRKGDSIEDSTEVASIVHGEHRADSKNYAVAANGAFFIKNVTTKDEGKYFCRGVTDESSSTVEIIVQLQASLQNFELSIDHCGTESSCSRNIDLSKPIELICIAINASPSMTLKWFSGSREIQSNITVVKYNQKDVPSSTIIRSTLKGVYRTPVTVTCQAVDTKSRADGGRFVNIRLEQPVPITNEKPAPDRGWMIATFITNALWIFCVTCTVMYMCGRSKRYLKNGRPSGPNNGYVPTGSVPTNNLP